MVSPCTWCACLSSRIFCGVVNVSTPDLINAAFEGVGAALSWGNVARLRRDREVKGVFWPVTAFFAAWGVWNVFYYPVLGKWASAVAGVVLCASNIVWVVLALRVKRESELRDSARERELTEWMAPLRAPFDANGGEPAEVP
jgi:hypothetical protein